jgi:antitoxin HicB
VASVASELKRYLALPYTRELVPEDDGTWYARILELPGCMSVGDTQVEALANLDDAMSAWLSSRLEDRASIPEPAGDFSGRFVVRVPKTLHRDLVKAARRNDISLNQFIATTLAQALGSALSSSAPATSSSRKEHG